jgi:hypothetical protein
MPQVGFELTISVFEGAKTVHAFDREATAIGIRRNRTREMAACGKARYGKVVPVLN